jgi:DsbC/DsbD-like thiol-disulfide interchange protein
MIQRLVRVLMAVLLLALAPAMISAVAQAQVQLPGLPRPPVQTRAEAEAASEVESEVTMQVRAFTEAVGPEQWTMLACTFTIPEGWHIYWRNSGESGMPTEVAVQAPAGFVVQPPVFPRPRVFLESSGPTFGYQNSVTILIPIRPPAKLPAEGTIARFEVDAFWLVCKERCFVGEGSVALELPISHTPQNAAVWARTLMGEPRWPRPLSGRPGTTATLTEGALVIDGVATRMGPTGFLPNPSPGVEMGDPELRIADGRFTLTIPVKIQPGDTLGKPPVAGGLLTFGVDDTMPCYEILIPIPIPTPKTDSETQTTIEREHP